MNKSKYKFFVLIFIVLMVLTGCFDQPKILPESLEITAEKTAINVEEELQLEVTVLPADASQTVVWSSSDETIITVDEDGTIQGVGAGTATITVSSESDSLITDSLLITVIQLVNVPEVSIVYEKTEMAMGEEMQLSTLITPVDNQSGVIWTSSKPEVAAVDASGKVTGIIPGTVNITAKLNLAGSISDSLLVTVLEPAGLADFDNFTEDIFLDMISEDPLNVNFFIRYPENFELGTLEVVPIEISLADHEQTIAELETLRANLLSYGYEYLTEVQRLTYAVLLDYLDGSLAYEDYYYYDGPLGSYLGYQAQLPFILAEYHFYSKANLDDYFDYLTTTQATFENIILFEQDRANNGFGMSDFILDKIIEQCDTFASAPDNYLIQVFNDKVDALDFLTAEEKTAYKATNLTYINVNFVGAYNYLSAELTKLKGRAVNNEGLADFEYGQEYYEILFREASGTDMTVSSALNYFRGILDSEYDELMQIYQANPNVFDLIASPTFLESRTYQETFDYLKSQYALDFPNIGEVAVTIKNIHPSLEENSSPAMYFLSPLDANVPEVIYINNTLFTDDPTYAYFTMAHESIPGHLLQHVVLKNSDLCHLRKFLDYTCYSEAWATYVEEYVGKYSGADADLLEAYHLNTRLTYVILCVADIYINYYGWSLSQFGSFLEPYFGALPAEDLQGMYYQLIEEPCNFFEYFFSYYRLLALKEEFIEQAEDKNYANVDYQFHKFYLETGPAPFYILEDQIPIYLNNN